jgi:hypothetical protein
MVDNSRLVAWLDHMYISSRRIRKMKNEMGIIPTKTFEKTSHWFDFKYQDQEFSLYSEGEDSLLFALNNQCPEEIIHELIAYLGVKTVT